MEIVLFWIVASVVVGVIAAHRGRSALAWTFYALFLTPLLMFVALLCIPNKAHEPTPDTHVKCPDCAELVRREANVCKHCGVRLIPQPAAEQG